MRLQLQQSIKIEDCKRMNDHLMPVIKEEFSHQLANEIIKLTEIEERGTIDYDSKIFSAELYLLHKSQYEHIAAVLKGLSGINPAIDNAVKYIINEFNR